MASEQAKGKRVDKRADIWSWGVVLHELLTGERIFQGDDAAETLAAIIHKQPDLERVPPKVRRLLGECLQKDPRQRLRDIGDAKHLLEEPALPATTPSRLWLGRIVVAAVLAMISVALGFVAGKHNHEEPPRVAKLFFPLPEKETLSPGNPPAIAVSPDGQRVAFEAVVDRRGELWVRDLDNSAARMLASGASGMPFWAPDSRRLGFFADGKLKKIDVTGGPAVTIADAQATTGGRGPWNGSWNQDDVIVFGRITSTLFRVSAGGGSPAPLADLDESRRETAHFAPWFLPDGHHFLYVAISREADKAGIYVADLAAKARKQVMAGNTRTIYVAPGYLLFVRDDTLMAQPFDTGKLATTGDAVPVAEPVDVFNAGIGVALGYFSASQNGVMMYTSGRGLGAFQLTWFDGLGRKLETVGAPGTLGPFSLSPDGTIVAFTRRDPQLGRYDLWTRDLTRGAESRLSTIGVGAGPVWSADGTQIFYASSPYGKIYRKAANNTGAEDVVDASTKVPADTSRDGRYLFTTSSGNILKTGLDIWVHPLFGDRKSFPYVQTEFDEDQPKLSPDGRWLAYRSNDSKRYEIYVVSFPKPGGKWQISTNGGLQPVWSHDGRELYYYGLDNRIMGVDIKPSAPGSPQFQFGAPRALFEVSISRSGETGDTGLAVSKDGHFLLPALVEQPASTPMTVVMNWPELLKKK